MDQKLGRPALFRLPRNARPRHRFALVAASSALLVNAGCAAIQVEHYYSPEAEEGELYGPAEDYHRHFEGGPPTGIRFERPELHLHVAVGNRFVNAIAVGPALPPLPIFPVFPINFFRPKKLSAEHITVHLRIDNVKSNVAVDFSKLRLVEPDGITLHPATGGETLIAPAKIGTYAIDFETSAELNAFALELHGISMDGEKIVFPIVNFRRARNWLLYAD